MGRLDRIDAERMKTVSRVINPLGRAKCSCLYVRRSPAIKPDDQGYISSAGLGVGGTGAWDWGCLMDGGEARNSGVRTC